MDLNREEDTSNCSVKESYNSMIRYFKKICTIILLLSSGVCVYAQESRQFNLYEFNPLLLNPAYAGTNNELSATAIHRAQWIGFEGAPSVQTVSIHSPIKKETIGLGFSIVNDKIGSRRRTWISADYSYTIKLNYRKDKLSFGVKAGFDIYNIDFSDRKVLDASDLVYSNPTTNKLISNFGFGVYYYNKSYYAAVTIPRLISNGFNNSNLRKIPITNRDVYLLGGYVFKVNSNFDFKPTIMCRYRFNNPILFSINLNVLMYDRLWLGLMYRYQESVGFNAIVLINKNVSVGYSYDYTTNKLYSYNNGGHEIMLRYNLSRSKKSFQRYF